MSDLIKDYYVLCKMLSGDSVTIQMMSMHKVDFFLNNAKDIFTYPLY